MKIQTILVSFIFACFCSNVSALPITKPFLYHAVVDVNGEKGFRTIQQAVDAMPEGRTAPWLIFVMNGVYDELVRVPKEKPFLHLIGQSRDSVIIRKTIHCGDPNDERIGQYAGKNQSVFPGNREGCVFICDASDFYAENVSFVNGFGVDFQAGPQALALRTNGDRTSLYNCSLRSFQDTWLTSTNDRNRHYVLNSFIEGAVDYIYGGGDVLIENTVLYNVRSGSVIVAPAHKEAKYGYAFLNCVVDGNKLADNGKQKLGRPWHNSPLTVYINTRMNISLAPEGWTNMGTVPGLFAEYNSVDRNGMPLDLSKRKTEYQRRSDNSTGTCRAVISKEEADRYSYENMVRGSDGWNPKLYMMRLPRPERIVLDNDRLSWKGVKGASGYLVTCDGKVHEFTKNTTLSTKIKDGALYTIQAISSWGGLGEMVMIK